MHSQGARRTFRAVSTKRLAVLGVWVTVSFAALAAPGAHAKSPAQCGPNDRPETGLQGQVPIADRASGRSVEGYTCNLTEVGFLPSSSFANFDAYENCAHYSDTIGLLADVEVEVESDRDDG